MRILLLAGILSGAAAAQGLTEVPPIIQLVRKPGTGGASLKPYANVGAAVPGQPAGWLALQFAMSMTETVLSSKFATYAVCV